MQPDTPLLTRRQLQAFGLTRYQAASLTKAVAVAEKRGSTNVYRLPDVLAATREYLDRRIQKRTRTILLELIERLQAMLGNVVQPEFGKRGDPEIQRAINKLKRSMANSDRASARLGAFAAELAADYGV